MDRIEAVAQQLQARLGDAPQVGVVLGSGMGAITGAMEQTVVVPYTELGLPPPGVIGHAGELVFGALGGVPTVCLSGRYHPYEGHPFATILLPVRALLAWGVRGMILTSAVGGIDPALKPGMVAIVKDHINFSGQNPLWGPVPPGGRRFPDLSQLYTPSRRALAQSVAGAALGPLPEVVYAMMPGPSYETPAEIRMLGRVGADVVGMSMVYEALAIGQLGHEVLSLAMVSNAAAGLGTEELTHTDVLAVVRRAAEERVLPLVQGVIQRWGAV